MNVENGSLESVNVSLAKIHNICATISDLLAKNLDRTGESVGQYAPSMIPSAQWDYVDWIVSYLILIKKHLKEVKTHLKSFTTPYDLQQIYIGLQKTVDQLDMIRMQSGFLYYTFSFLIDEIQTECKTMQENFMVYEMSEH